MKKSKHLNGPASPGGYILKNVLLGAAVGGAITAFKNAGKVNNGEMSKDEALKDSLREAGTFGASTGTAAAVVTPLPLGPVSSALGYVAVASGTKYMLNQVIPAQKKPNPLEVRETPSKKEAKTEQPSKKDKSKPAAKAATKSKTKGKTASKTSKAKKEEAAEQSASTEKTQ